MADNSDSSDASKTGIPPSLCPVTIAQLNKARWATPDSLWTLENTTLGQVTTVAHVLSVIEKPSSAAYLLDDAMGKMKGRFWSEANRQENNIKMGALVRVNGLLKMLQDNDRYININQIRSCADPHEIYFHAVECVTTTLAFDHRTQKAKLVVEAATSQDTDAAYGHLPEIEKRIMKFIAAQPSKEEGIHVGTITSAIGVGNNEGPNVSSALDHLMNEGLIFTTIDDSHFDICT